jgi:hypothetical protein
MTVTYTKVLGAPAIHRWPGGLVATTFPWTGSLPHDLGHWIMEAQVDLPYGFWSLAAQKAPFSSFTLVSGRWPKDRADWLDRVRRKHGVAMLHAEGHGGAWLADPDLDVHGDWPTLRRRLARAYTFEEHALMRLTPSDVEGLVPLARAVVAQWEALAPGGCLLVRWPGSALPEEVDPLTYGPATLPAEHRIAVTVSTAKGELALKAPAAKVRRPRRPAAEDRRPRHRRR